MFVFYATCGQGLPGGAEVMNPDPQIPRSKLSMYFFAT